MKNTQVLLLAGGLGTRMAPLEVCKSLISFAGKPICRYVFDDMKKAGFNNFKIICNKKDLGKMKKAFKGEKANIKFYIQKNIPGMAGAVLSVNDLGKKPIVIVNPEDLLHPKAYVDFGKLIKKTKNKIILTGIYKKDYFPGGYFKLAGNKIIGLVEKPAASSQPSNYVNLVLHYFKDSQLFINYLKKTSIKKDDLYEAAIDKMLKNNFPAEVFKYDGYWQSLKYPWHILEMMELILSKRLKNKISSDTEIHKTAIIDGPVVIEPGVKVFERAVIKGPAFIGKNSIIGTNSFVRESNIAENCLVGYNSEVARSWIGNNCWLHNNYIGDSVLENNAHLGCGAVTANFRLDEKEISVKKANQKINTKRFKFGAVLAQNVRVGVNASLMPGISVGSSSFVGSGIVLNKNLDNNKYTTIAKKAYSISNLAVDKK